MTENCANCRFVKKPKGLILANTALACRRHAPQNLIIPGHKSMEVKALYPMVGSVDWCGDWFPAVDETEHRPASDYEPKPGDVISPMQKAAFDYNGGDK